MFDIPLLDKDTSPHVSFVSMLLLIEESLTIMCKLYIVFKGVIVFKNDRSEMHGPTCYQCLWYGVRLKP